MPRLSARRAGPTDAPTQFRQLRMLVLGYGLMAGCAVSAFLTAQTMPGVGFREVLLPVSGAILAWALLLRPSVDIGEQAVTVRNVGRDVQIPWARIESIQT
ncbi:MAG: PH domain-containing protein, partial [Allobranchiibius sp.]